MASSLLPDFDMQHLELANIHSWPLWFIIAYCGVIMLGLEILSTVIPLLFSFATKVNYPKEMHLDQFSLQDNLFIFINKLLTIMFVYHVIQVCYYTSTIEWDMSKMTIGNTVGSLILFYIFYDFLYMNFHRFLHLNFIYGYVHKHHHRQKVPTRGNLDAINVHPFEFLVGEYIHLVTIYFIPAHICAIGFFILAGGILASLNHTRLDLSIIPIFQVKAHAVHHEKNVNSNYGQYTMFWDHFFCTYKDFDRDYGKKE